MNRAYSAQNGTLGAIYPGLRRWAGMIDALGVGKRGSRILKGDQGTVSEAQVIDFYGNDKAEATRLLSGYHTRWAPSKRHFRKLAAMSKLQSRPERGALSRRRKSPTVQ